MGVEWGKWGRGYRDVVFMGGVVVRNRETGRQSADFGCGMALLNPLLLGKSGTGKAT
jgi:hypothetical protein